MRLCHIIFVLGFAAANAWSADLPCVAAESALRGIMTDPLNEPFLACLRTSRVCVLSMSTDEMWASNSIREVPEKGQAVLGIVQTAPSDAPALCLAGI